MWEATLWGAVAGSATFIGALFAILTDIKENIIGIIMAFGTGVLIGAASFELLENSISEAGLQITILSFILGAFIFTIFNLIISHKGGHGRKRSYGNLESQSGLAIFVGTLMDAIPESIIIGMSLRTGTGVSLLLVIAIFISNFPEGLSSSLGLKKNGFSNLQILLLWFAVLILSLLSSVIGFVFLGNSPQIIIGAIGAFAAGGIVAMVSSTMMPEAYEEGGPIVGFISALGLTASLLLANL